MKQKLKQPVARVLSAVLLFLVTATLFTGCGTKLKIEPYSPSESIPANYRMLSKNEIAAANKQLSSIEIRPIQVLQEQDFIKYQENALGIRYTIGCLYYKDADGNYVVYSILPDSFVQGKIKPNDIIISINGQSPDKFIPHKGEKITITYKRGDKTLKTKSVIGIINIPSVYGELVANGKIEYIRILHFNDKTYSQLQNILKTTENKIIIDLRNANGNNIDAALQSLSLFLPSGQVGILKTKINKTPLYVKGLYPEPVLKSRKIIIIVNSKTNNAAEYFAFMMQKNKAAEIIGEEIKEPVVLYKFYKINNAIALVPYALVLDNNNSSLTITPDKIEKDDNIECPCKSILIHEAELDLLSE